MLENITGIQITREAGVGTGVQIRGTDANRTEINGVSTVGSGAGRSGIDFEDVSASIIAGLEVTKSPDAKTIEGSVGGTINLKQYVPCSLMSNSRPSVFRAKIVASLQTVIFSHDFPVPLAIIGILTMVNSVSSLAVVMQSKT